MININKLIKTSDFRLLVTPYQNKKLPVYNWYNYKHSFSRDLVLNIINKIGLSEKIKILDPFCGSGTTLLASKEMGFYAIGIDILPLSIFVTNSKLMKYDKQQIIETLNEVEEIIQNPFFDAEDYVHYETLIKFFPKNILDKVLSLKNWIDNQDKQIKYFLLTALLSILESISYTSKDGAFLRIIKEKQIPDFNSTYLNRLHEMINDIDFINELPDVEVTAIEGDARNIGLKSEIFSAIITSPPYPNRHDYTRTYLLELLIGFVRTEDKVKKLRYSSIRSHVEAKKRYNVEEYKPPEILITILKKLNNEHLPNKQIISMLKGYFEDMYLAFKEFERVIEPDGKIVLVVGDVRYGGIKIPVGDILINIGSQIGLEFEGRIIARVRGNSPQQMKKYGKEPMEESILIWQKK